MKRFILLMAFGLGLHAAKSQAYTTSADIYLGLKKLNTLGSVLYVAAHPDDENTRLISYFSKDKLYRTGYLSMTRGDGGQNLIGDEQGIELGLIRTQELLSARRIDGGEQFFTRAFDFGYSKTPEETFSKWDKEKALADVVWIIRKFQPDVIITRFPVTGEGGHGHHTASAILAKEAFTAAADPKRFPEQLQYVTVWQAKRILWNGFNFNNAAPPADAFKIDVGGYNAVLGKSYGEIAAESRSQHKSQGFGSSGNRGEVYEFFRTMGGTTPVNDLFEDIETSWAKIQASHISKSVEAITASFDFLHPEKSVKSLVALYNTIGALPASGWKTKKLNEVAQLIEACSGLFADATTSVAYVAQTDSVRINFLLNNRLGSGITLQGIRIEGFDTVLKKPLARNINLNLSKTLYVPSTQPVTQPYWLVQEMKEGYFEVNDQQLIGQPDVQPAYTASFILNIEGAAFEIRRKVRYRFNDPVRGEVYQPFVVVPPYTVSLNPSLTLKSTQAKTQVIYTSHKNSNNIQYGRQGNHSFVLNKGQSRMFETGSDAVADQLLMPVHHTERKKGTAEKYIHDLKDEKTGTVLKDMIQISYDHIPRIYYFRPARHVLLDMDLTIAGKKVGYIVGAGDKVPDALEQMGYEVTLLTEKELAKNNLAQFDAIISGVRAYNTNEWLNQYHDRLMNYVKNGGNLIVQYNTSSNIGPVRAKIGPYAFDISRNRITDENSPVVFTQPAHQVFHYPNRIGKEDFQGWVQERSIYHATKADTAFHTLLQLKDPGEQPDNGSLITASYGKGHFTYTGLAFFRQLPAGVPGAYRLMANLIALNRKKEF